MGLSEHRTALYPLVNHHDPPNVTYRICIGTKQWFLSGCIECQEKGLCQRFCGTVCTILYPIVRETRISRYRICTSQPGN